MNIMENFLQEAKQNNYLVSVFLSTGVKLQGHVVQYDDNTVYFSCSKDANRMVIFTSYITTLSYKTKSPCEDC